LPSDRGVLHARIRQRLTSMFEQGFVDEVRALMARGDLHPELPAMRAVGYRQMWAALASGEDPASAAERILVATRQYARRQLTWLRGERRLESVDFDTGEAAERLAQRLGEWLLPPETKK
ncbi:MAG: hypothetical protein R3308_10130, partial [Thiohalobacterales bacterium]|nr:hypothetical protein [Thiohalobacterales bacterium]